MACLFAGPWVGEFGWELMSWQGLVRRLAKNYDSVIVCSRPGHQALYADFVTKYLPHDVDGVKDCQNIMPFDPLALPKLNSKIEDMLSDGQMDHLKPRGLCKLSAQRFIKFGVKGHVCAYDVIVHARGNIGKRQYHAYPMDLWDTLVHGLVSSGITVAAIGSTKESFLPGGAIDLRGLPLQYVMDAMSACHVVAGPSSGPMHLASLCRAAHVVWTDKTYYSAINGCNRMRYEQLWNPLATPCRVIDEYGWHPPPRFVLPVIIEEVERGRKHRHQVASNQA